jgi:adhesin transport system membrane fusion protein
MTKDTKKQQQADNTHQDNRQNTKHQDSKQNQMLPKDNTQQLKNTEQPVNNHNAEAIDQDELEYISDSSASVLIKPSTGGSLIIYTLFAFLIAAVLWANFSTIEEITRGEGIIIPSSKIQVIQNLEGGILKKLFVKEGDIVKANQPLAQLDNTRFSSSFHEKSFEYFSDLAKISRLEAEINSSELRFPKELNKYADYIERETTIYNNRKQSFQAEQDILNRQIHQAQYEVDSAKSQLQFLEKSYSLIESEINLTKPLLEEGVVSRVEFLQLQQRATEIERDKNQVKLSIPKLDSIHQEAKSKLNELKLNFRSELSEEIKETAVNLDQLRQNTLSLEDQLERTLVRSPMNGIIKKIFISTEGGVAQPGMSLMEIVPVENNLLVEVQVNPKDIGFLTEGMPAVVKLTAYDFAIYGGLKGKVEHISADTHEDEKGNSYYLVNVITDNNFLQIANKQLDIIPGMRGTVDIITGKKTFMDYILKPILRAKQTAFTER